MVAAMEFALCLSPHLAMPSYPIRTSAASSHLDRHAGSTDAKPWLAAHPVKASWQDATHELLAQYEEAIEANLPARQALASYISILDQLMRAALLTFGTWWLMRAYTGKILKMVLYIIEDLASP